ncbi:peptide chain release factor N(5)-glutamine methyltransferase [Thalassospira mesophila]|uniref:Release factor glutamine methyltransferase n=1 Tax=Thalassospira mesophila TaxID=1293891 RepID=A0A1Y2L0A9_9PROT|nr:peptide chain release factor N(5)-glutamine methyltransferase [Thalassospira mesophila]OSQ38281.1 modification methylase HemK [Thalassospira mesophila]
MTPQDHPTLGSLMLEATAQLKQAGCDTARLDARILLSSACDVDASKIMAWPENPVEPVRAAAFREMIRRRATREPVSRILGQRDFWRHSFKITPATLDPRPDSETLVEWAIERAGDFSQPRLIDFGTGTGCLLLSVLGDVADSFGIGVDISAGAVQCATGNAVALGLDQRSRFVVSDWDCDLDAQTKAAQFDIMISNPPYIALGEMPGLTPEVRDFDPFCALSDGADGLDAYRILTAIAARLVRPSGWVLFEIGQGQQEAVSALLAQHEFGMIQERCDLGGIVRCVGGQKRS